jgi:hypothetical protein
LFFLILSVGTVVSVLTSRSATGLTRLKKLAPVTPHRFCDRWACELYRLEFFSNPKRSASHP